MLAVYTFILLLEVLVVIRTFFSLYKKDIFCAFFYAILFYFCLNFSVRYLYAPESLMDNPYILPDFIDDHAQYWLQYNLFTFSSLLVFWYVVTRSRLSQKRVLLRIQPKARYAKLKTFVGITCFALFTLFSAKFFLSNLGAYSYANVVNAASDSVSVVNNIQMQSFMLICGAISILLDRNSMRRNAYVLVAALIVINISVLTVFCLITGNRDAFVSVVFSLCVVLLYTGKITFRQCLPFCVLGALGLFFISQMRGIHDESALMGVFFPNGVSQNMFDTFAVIRYEYVEPLEVVLCTIMKSLPKTGGNYLHVTLGQLYSFIDMSGNVGFSHFLFGEGFAFMGYMGFLYNGLIVGAFVVLWRRLASSNDEGFNRYMIAVISAMTLMLIRGVGMCAFIKYLYQYIIPAIVFYLLLTGKGLTLVIRRDKTRTGTANINN